MVHLQSLIMAKEASLCLLFLSSILISSSGALVGFSYHVTGDTSTPAGTKYVEVAQFSKRVSKYLEAKTPITKRIAALYAQVHPSEIFAVSSREIRSKRRSLDDTNTVYPTNPTPTITPPDTPTIITVPSSTNPVTISPTNPAAMPANVPSTTPSVPLPPPTNPANSPVPVTNPATTPTPPTTVPVTNPVTSYPPPSGNVPVTNPQPPPSNTNAPSGNVPVTSYPPPSGNVPVTNPQPPPSNTNAPAVQGQSWCVAKTGAPQASLQSALDYACGMGGADCSQIQQGGSCYSPVTLQNHASFAFNSYYQKNPSPTSCDFGGAATLVNTNPSSGSCIFPSSASSASSSSSTPMTPSPTPPTQSTPTTPPPSPKTPSIPTTSPPSIPTAPPTSSGSGSGTSGYGTPPTVLNSSNPASGTMPDFGSESPPVVNTTSASHSLALKPFTACIVLMISFVTVRLSMSP